MHPRVRVVTLFLAVAFALPVFGAEPAAATDTIQPGDLVHTSVGSCTLNFVFDGTGPRAGNVYIGTAAHCVRSVGELASTGGGEEFGVVAAFGNPWRYTARDWALIEVLPEFESSISPTLKGHPAYPTGYTTADETNVGDLVQLSGYGVPFYATTPTQEQRRGVVSLDEEYQHRVYAPLLWGDSGGPIVHVPTGKALGIVSRLCTALCTETGPTVRGIVEQAAAAGFPVTLRTV